MGNLLSKCKAGHKERHETNTRNAYRGDQSEAVEDAFGGEEHTNSEVKSSGAPVYNYYKVNVTGNTRGNPETVNAIGIQYNQASKAKAIEERTKRDIQTRTENMVKTSALREVLDKLDYVQTWITIKGSPGEGKTTTACMALKELQESGRHVFQAWSPEDFSEITNTCSNPVIMLDDVLGDLELDLAALSRWKPAFHKVLDEKEGRSHKKDTQTTNEDKPIVILVGRENVLKPGSQHLGKLSNFITKDEYVINMSHMVERDFQEKLAIWNANSQSSGVDLDQRMVHKICRIKCPHGFPHVCRLYVTMQKEGRNIDVEKFFKTPLDFLNQTVAKFIRNEQKLFLFKEMMKHDGKVSVRDLDSSIIHVAEDLVGTYLRKNVDDYFLFDHPSIYDSVAYHLCELAPLFVIENCNLSFIHQRLRLMSSRGTRHSSSSSEAELVVHIPWTYADDLAKRFAAELANKNLIHVLSHTALTDELFIEKLMSKTDVKIPLTELVNSRMFDQICNDKILFWKSSGYGDVKYDQYMTRACYLNPQKECYKILIDSFLTLLASSTSPELLKYIDRHTNIRLTETDIGTVLYGVCKYAASDVLQYLADTRPTLDINVAYFDKKTPLIIAAATKDSQFVQKIMLLNPDIDPCDNYRQTAFFYMCKNGHVLAVKEVIDRKYDIASDNGGDRSPLSIACENNQVEIAKLLCDSGARIDYKSVKAACIHMNIQVVKKLLEKWKTVDKTSEYGRLLVTACRHGHMEVIHHLISEGASVNTGDGNEHPLHGACRGKNHQVVQYLLKNGAVITCRDNLSHTPLHIAAEEGSKECVEVLLKAAANVQNIFDSTPLHKAAKEGSKERADVFLKAAANVQNIFGSTPLHKAAKSGQKECVDFLLKAGADAKVKDTEGSTPLHEAAKSGSKECVVLLLKAGADANVQDIEGSTPQHEAAKNASKECVDLLLKAGADAKVLFHSNVGRLQSKLEDK